MSTVEMIRQSEAAARPKGPLGLPANVGRVERLLSNLGGGILLGVGAKRGGVAGLALAGLGSAMLYRGVTGRCHGYAALGITTADDHPGEADSIRAQHGVRIEDAMTVEGSPEALYAYWRNYANLPRFQERIESVTQIGDDPKKSRWVMNAPFGQTLTWDAELIEDVPGKVIAWRSLEGSDVDTAGSVRFVAAPGGRGTVVRVNQKFDPPGGKIGVAIASLIGQGPGRLTRDNLRRFKMLMEAGEIATIVGQSKGGGRQR